jgi:hypothetical protein
MAIETIDPALVAGVSSFATAATPALILVLGSAIAVRTWRRASGRSAWSLGLAALSGALLGSAVVASAPVARAFDLPKIFSAGSPWDISGVALLEQCFPETLGMLPAMLEAPLAMLPHPLGWLMRAFLFSAAAAVLIPIAGMAPRRAALAVVLGFGVAAFALVTVVYLACFGPWLLNLLNFWSLGLLLTLFVYWRHGTL